MKSREGKAKLKPQDKLLKTLCESLGPVIPESLLLNISVDINFALYLSLDHTLNFLPD